MPRTLPGLHHVTAITADPQRNLDFYTSVLGLRLVKLTVNFDDPASYHLYYGDSLGRPGTAITFFAWPGADRGRIGPPQVTTTAFTGPAGSRDYWTDRLQSHGVTLSEESHEKTASLLTDVMGFRAIGQEGNRFRYQANQAGEVKTGDGFASIVDLLCVPGARRGSMGAGVVHHVAFRTPDDIQQAAWREQLIKLGYNVSPVMDRNYFHSIYYREPGGVLFEIATETPGFAIDEDPQHLGSRRALPSWMEPYRRQIEQALPPLRLPAEALVTR